MTNILGLIIISTFLTSAIALIGIIILIFQKRLLNERVLSLVSLAAGGMMGGAFLHLLPEAILKGGCAEGKIFIIFLEMIFGFCVFFIAEQFLRWHHCHRIEHKDCSAPQPLVYLALVSDSVHNFIDGLIIAAAFISNIPLGIATTFAVILHEVPQELGDFGVLVYSGLSITKALILNFFSGLIAVFGGILGFLLMQRIEGVVAFLLPFAAGHFIYLAASDLIPEIKHKEKLKISLVQFFVFLIGIGLMLAIKLID